jgi:hypothetical protein
MAGRKKMADEDKRQMVSFRIPPFVIEKLNERKVNKSKYITNAIVAQLICDGVTIDIEDLRGLE